MYWKEAQRERTKLCRLLGVLWNQRRWFVQVTWCRESWGCFWWVKFGRKSEWRWRREEQIYVLNFLRFLDSTCIVGQRTQNGPTFIFHNHRSPHHWVSRRLDFVLAVWNVYNAGDCFCIPHHIYRSDLVHLATNWVVLRLSQLRDYTTWRTTRLAVEKAHATDVMRYSIQHFSICDAFSSAQGGFPLGSSLYTQSMVRSTVQRMSAMLWWSRQEGINAFQAVQIDLQMLL